MEKNFEQIFASRNPNYTFLIERMREALGVESVEFDDINAVSMRLFKEHMESLVSANSCATYFAVVKATISEMAGDGLINNPKCASVLKVRKTPVQNYCLTEEELAKLDEYEPRSTTEKDAKIIFMRGAYSGARSCDCKAMTEENIADGQLTYVSQKTKTGVSQPLHHRLRKYLSQQPSKAHSRAALNYSLQAMCRKLGFNEPVTLSRDGKQVTKPKYEWITMHCARRGYVTSLVSRNVPVGLVSKLAGHSDVRMTSRYICGNSIPLPKEAMEFFGS